MHTLKNSFRAASRRKGKSMIVLAVSMVLVLFFTMYANAITEHRETLAALHKSITVTGQITNYNGTVTDDLDIPEKIIRELETSDFIGERFYTRNLCLLTEPWEGLELSELQNRLMNAGRLVGANAIEAIPEFAAEDAIQPQYWEGYDASLFASSERVCILSEDLLQGLNLQLGDSFKITVAENARVESADHPHGEIALQIVGVFSGPAWRKAYCPWDTITAVYEDLGIPLTWDSARFCLENTLKMHELKALLSRLNFLSPYEVGQDAITGQGRLGFVINDRILTKATGGVKSYIGFMTALYPVIYLLSAGIGFVVSYLLIRLRKPEFAIMRSLGAGKGMSFLSFFWEQVLLSLLGTALGVLLTLALVKTVTPLQAFSIAGYLVSYQAGAALAIATMNRMNIIQILTAKE